MAVLNEVPLSRVQEFGRTDAEYFKPTYEASFRRVSFCQGEKIARLANITDGIHASPEITENGIRYISAKCVKDNEFVINGCINISQKQHEANPRTQLRAGDVIITTVGTIGNVAVVDEDITPCNCDRHVGIIRIKEPNDFSPFYLSTFLNSKYGQFQSLRESAGNVQLNLYIKNIGHIVVPRLGDAELEIAELTRTAYLMRRKSKTIYTQARKLLESELGLDKLLFQKPVGYTARFSELNQSLRSDAQHYQPRFVQLFSHLAAFPIRRVREIRTVNRRGLQPIYVSNGPVDVVNSQHLGPKHVDYDGLQRTSEMAFASSIEGHIRNNDLLIYTTGAYIGRTNVYLRNTPALASNHVNILRLIPEIDAAYMALVFQSIIGQFQTQKHARGSAQAELYPMDIDRFIVPLLDPTKQRTIGDLVRESLLKQKESNALLAQAKTRVEQLIEEAVKS
ncbi:MAG: restriction endonuclease subunit S [Syntrophobacterales bacterium]|nr:restriction endonuclease subunit S [Syntrophobacterales bacterium]